MPSVRKQRSWKDQRIDHAISMIRLQREQQEIVRSIVEKFRCTGRCAYNDVRRAYERLEAEGIQERPYRKHQLRSTLRGILGMALKKGDLTNAIKVCVQLAKIDGLYAPEVVKLEAKEAEVANMTSDEQRRELDALVAKYSHEPGNGFDNGNGRANGSGNGALN